MQKLQLFSSAQGKSLQPALGQACDQCRRRKTRCNRAHPCVHCEKTGQTCSYVQAPKTRGRRPKRKLGLVVEDEAPTQIEQADAAVWTDTLPDLTCYMPPAAALGTMDDLQLPLTPGSVFDWQTSDLNSTATLCNEVVKTPLQIQPQDTWCDSSRPPLPQLLDRQCFIPYIHLFFERLYAIFPVIEKEPLLAILEAPSLQGQPLPSNLYAFLTALSAAVIVQLNITDTESSVAPDSQDAQAQAVSCPRIPAISPDLLIAQCLETRRSTPFIEDADEWTILTSFFVFSYYGNFDQSKSAWYYLREAIGFAQSLGLDDADTYITLDANTAQRRRLLFWLLFVTERAYALQHHSRVMLRQSVPLPHVFESSEPKLIYGFVTLARVFSAVDSAFISAWRTQNTPTALSAVDASGALSKLLREGGAEVDAVAAGEINETQRLDILITQQYLKTVAWQLQANIEASPNMQTLHGSEAAEKLKRDSSLVIRTSKSLLDVVISAHGPSLEAHGIGVEFKVSEVAHSLCEVLESSQDDDIALEFFSTQDFLHQFMVFLADFRRRESQYLQPLLQRASRCLSRCIQPQRPLLEEEGQGEWEAGEGFLEGRGFYRWVTKLQCLCKFRCSSTTGSSCSSP